MCCCLHLFKVRNRGCAIQAAAANSMAPIPMMTNPRLMHKHASLCKRLPAHRFAAVPATSHAACAMRRPASSDRASQLPALKQRPSSALQCLLYRRLLRKRGERKLKLRVSCAATSPLAQHKGPALLERQGNPSANLLHEAAEILSSACLTLQRGAGSD